MVIWDGCYSQRLIGFEILEPIVFGAHRCAAVYAFEAAHGEMALREILKMLGKSEVDCRSTDRSYNRHRLGRELLGDHRAKPIDDWR